MNISQTDNIIESYEIEKINLLRADLAQCRPKPYRWLIQWVMCLVTIATISYIAEFDLLVEQNFVWLLLLLFVVTIVNRNDDLAHKRIDLIVKLLDKSAFDKR
ncbi:hypothetical protein [Shewanella livingstonensis]|uniref:Uncharacterized protein n=1 Tax=Shewanella livingstonensis TaxID=150120 RepID=A0A3G8LT34_9GAMM|nr:hypothetical protein [Shewanella livingstonensis]AZG72943.1 hypothetical protein EGC82_09315 [Shewanella livingstonensis]